jgi:hypothetical protein
MVWEYLTDGIEKTAWELAVGSHGASITLLVFAFIRRMVVPAVSAEKDVEKG